MHLIEFTNPEDSAEMISGVEDLVRNIERIRSDDDFAFSIDFDRPPIKRLDEP
jgi:hypothetical protein